MSKPEKAPERVKYIKISELRTEGDQGSCLRPLGLCELGGCCDVCWYGGARGYGDKPLKKECDD